MNVHIRKRRSRPLFEAFGKSIYDVEWINGDTSRVILLKIDRARATREGSFYVSLSCHPNIVHTFGLVCCHLGSVILLQERTSLGDLSKELQEGNFQPIKAVLSKIFEQITDALIFLAGNGMSRCIMNDNKRLLASRSKRSFVFSYIISIYSIASIRLGET